MQVKEHYDKHLANFYSWMLGDLDAKSKEFKTFLLKKGIQPINTKIAIDLGVGNGIQSIALKELGFVVTAVDFNEQLLNELESNSKGKGINIVQEDIRNVLGFKKLRPEIIVCCGDTITHLENKQQIEKLLGDANNILTTNGTLILTFRDYSSQLNDQQRFIPVRSTANRILTCILDYGAEKVKVTDLLYERINSEWIQKVSTYEKVRISPKEVLTLIEKNGMIVKFNKPINRIQTIIAEKRV
nr:methyltransferase domain-containing protein [Allomuricauda sp.]